jgi:PAS domain S-box-containing protein
MDAITIAWSMCSAASLMLGLMHVFLWLNEQRSPVYLLLTLASLGAATSALAELSLMHAESTAAYSELLRWQNLAIFLILIPLVWAVYLHLGTGRRWLAWIITGLWTISIVINFASPGNLVFLEVEALRQLHTFWGETFVGALGVRNPWVIVPDIASFFIFLFFVDTTVRSWRRGHRQRALAVGVGATGFILIAGVHAPLVDAGIVQTPYMVSFAFLTMVLAMSYELVTTAVRASRYAQELEAGNRRWNAFLNDVQLPVMGIVPDGAVSYVNPFFERLSGYGSAEIVGQAATRLVPEANVVELAQRLRDAADRPPRPRSQWTLLCRSGERRQVLLSSVRQESPEGAYEGILTIGEDITDRLGAERELAGARREMERLMRANMLGELASALAHELNQPLAAILSNAQAAQRLLGSDALDPRELAEILDDIVRDDRRASEVIARMRSMVRKGEMQLEPVDLNGAVRDVIDLMHIELDTQNVRLSFTPANELPPVVASPVDIQQVIMNLLMNAVRAVKIQPENARQVDILTKRVDGRILLSVEDSGAGIPGQVLDRMFEPFFTTKTVGIGMGLAICRRIVDAHGGRIRAENRETGGARVSVELPLAGNGRDADV